MQELQIIIWELRKPQKKMEALPGVGTKSAQSIISEIGIDMTRFPTASHLCAWVGLVLGNNESAVKRKSAKS